MNLSLEELKAGIVLPVNKPRQWSSFQVVNRLKWHIKHEFDIKAKSFKIGHAGTLDPLADGLLLVCVGKATKRIDELQSGQKIYTGTMVLGATTPCFDLERPIDHYFPYEHISRDSILQVIPEFIGTINQIPPHFSAVKVDGERAYNSAREGEEITIAPKKVNIYEFVITDFRPGTPCAEPLPQPVDSVNTDARELYRNPLGQVPSHLPQLDFRIRCGKGTYIRSIARDLGTRLSSGAFLSALHREQVGQYLLSQALSPDEWCQSLKCTPSPTSQI